MFGLKPLLGLVPMAPIRPQLLVSHANHSTTETCVYVCMYVRMYVCMYVCMYVHMYMYVYMYMLFCEVGRDIRFKHELFMYGLFV